MRLARLRALLHGLQYDARPVLADLFRGNSAVGLMLWQSGQYAQPGGTVRCSRMVLPSAAALRSLCAR